MSAQFILGFGKQFVRVLAMEERTICELVNRSRATCFTSEAEAWAAATRLRLTPDLCRVISVNQREAA